MKRLLFAAVLSLFCTLALAAPGEKSPLPAPLASQFKQAVDLLNGYRGDRSALVTALANLDGILKAKPDYAPAHREMARYFMMDGYMRGATYRPGSLEKADEAIKKALAINPTFAEAYVLRGHLYLEMGRPVESRAALQQADKLGTSDPWLHNNWADLLIKEGKIDEAAERYRKVLSGSHGNKKATSAAFDGLIDYYRAKGDIGKMDETYRKQIAFEPESAWNHGNYAQFLICYTDNVDAAIGQAREALNIMNYGVGRYWLAAGLYRKWAQSLAKGAKDMGRAYYNEARELSPELRPFAERARTCRGLQEVAQLAERIEKTGNPMVGVKS